MPTQVGYDEPVLRSERRDDRPEHISSGHQAMQEQQRLSGAELAHKNPWRILGIKIH
jgi:hypothetical protein